MKKNIIVSGVNFSEGGPLTVMKSALEFLDTSPIIAEYNVIALVHSKKLYDNLRNIELLEFPHVKEAWKNRIKFEYFECRSLSQKLDSHLWLSLHDITPNVISEKRAVYCHNASPFYKQNLSNFLNNPKRFLYTKFYKQLYRINIHKNDYVVVQQKWIKDAFLRLFNLKNEKVVVALPNQGKGNTENVIKNFADVKSNDFVFFYPAFPREFKNFEIICKAVEILKAKGKQKFKVKLTIDGSENPYSKNIVDRFSKNKEIEFTGLLSKDEVEDNYALADCLVFPSKLETWGLPISEFKKYHKPMLVANLPYAYETVGNYSKVHYFDVLNEQKLAESMLAVMDGSIKYTNKGDVKYEEPLCRSWDELFKLLLK
ncbi:hypothetical protein OK18_02595 [Chryseobacterium gallinarum]|uniref:Glycosyl transferase family 1 domain-containing protein n=1 Tax=Chryseobacterium gallinarum TaxID=1324352 RepID=A0A0G3LYI9_CHRGL|nr:glycosyltransferase [Chryseobacterium gallinarum]AKK71674.1 hypothetical protein OK18_02595 [Chryseobacterium gallinarum]